MLPERCTYPSPGFSEYWLEGRGRSLLKKLKDIPSKESIDVYSERYNEYDALADTVVIDLFEGLGHKEGHLLLNDILTKGIEGSETVPESLKQLIREAETIPDWLNETLLETGSAFCRRTGPFALVVLRNYCLMGGYESSAINKALIYTGALRNGAYKRMTETLDFWVDVTGKDALRRLSPGFKSAVKVRIIHALARVYTQRMPGWSNQQWGVPLNQGDMVATNLGFSLVFLEGLRNLGFKPSEEEIKGLFHFWKYIGYLLGIPVTYLPDTEKEAIESLYKWTMTQPVADEDTKALAHALMLAPLQGTYPKHHWQRVFLTKTHLGFNQYFLGSRACARMSLPQTIFRYFPYIALLLNTVRESIVSLSTAAYHRAVEAGRMQQEIIREGFVKAVPVKG